MAGQRPSASGRNTSARNTTPSSIAMGASQSMRMPSRVPDFISVMASSRPHAAGSSFPNLFQNLGAVFAEARRGTVGGHGCAVEHNGSTDAGTLAALGSRVFQFELHAAVDDLRISKDLFEIVDRSGG